MLGTVLRPVRSKQAATTTASKLDKYGNQTIEKPRTKSGAIDKRFKKDRQISTASPKGTANMSSMVIGLNTINWMLATTYSYYLTKDKNALLTQTRDQTVKTEVSFGNWEIYKMRSHLTLALEDVSLAKAEGIIDPRYHNDLEALSQITNIVLFGGDGSESAEIKAEAQKVIDQVSSRRTLSKEKRSFLNRERKRKKKKKAKYEVTHALMHSRCLSHWPMQSRVD